MDRSAGGGAPGEGTDALTAQPGERTPPSVLILFSDTGGGHRAAAQALDGALRSLAPEVSITWCDPLIGQGRAIARRISSLYPTIIRRSPPTWGAIFHATNTAPSFAAVRAALGTQLRSVLDEALQVAAPDVVLSVHPLLNHLTAGLLDDHPRRLALMTVVTDLVDLHRGWTCGRADLMVVPTEQALRTALRRRMPAERLRLVGLPVDLRFRPPIGDEPARTRAGLGLDPMRPTVLVSGGGEGSGRMFDHVLALAWIAHPWQLIVVCGRNELIRKRLSTMRLETPTALLGFVDDMPELLRAADLAVGKAGPGLISEALVTGVPMLLTGYLPGQERGNVRFVVEERVGRYTPSPRRLVAAVKELLAGDGAVRRLMAGRATELSRPRAALEIAAACLELGAPYRASEHAIR